MEYNGFVPGGPRRVFPDPWKQWGADGIDQVVAWLRRYVEMHFGRTVVSASFDPCGDYWLLRDGTAVVARVPGALFERLAVQLLMRRFE
jgi:hypothetical protein